MSVRAVREFLCLDDWGVQAEYIDAAGVSSQIVVLFQGPGSDLTVGPFQVESTQPVAYCDEDDVPAVNHSCKLAINDITYKVVNTTPDGSGMMKLTLSKD